jgi:hypothetical protein
LPLRAEGTNVMRRHFGCHALLQAAQLFPCSLEVQGPVAEMEQLIKVGAEVEWLEETRGC